MDRVLVIRAASLYFPVAVLPGWMQVLAKGLPVTHGLEALRRALLQGAGLRDVSGSLVILLGFSLAGWPLALWAFQASLDAARRRASLGHY